jgi:hypothetical protein
MKISRIALLSAVFCATSMFADDAVANVATQPGIISQVTGFVTAPFVYAFDTADGITNWIADKSYLNTIIGKITGVSFLKDTRINNPALIGQSLVAVAAVYAAYKAYQKLNEQNADNDDDMIFIDEEYAA